MSDAAATVDEQHRHLPPDLTSDTGTLQELGGVADARRARNLRRVPLTLMALFVLAGLVGLFGTRTATSESQADGWTLTAHTPQITRPALSSPIDLTVQRGGGFSAPIEIRVDRAFFPHFDANAVVPAPSAETGTPDYVVWTFDKPPGDTLTITIDTRVGPSEMPGPVRLGFAVVVDGEPVVAVSPLMIVLP